MVPVHHHPPHLGAGLYAALAPPLLGLHLGTAATLRRSVQAWGGLPLRSRVGHVVLEMLLLLEVLIEGRRHLLRFVELAWLAKVGLRLEALG